MEATTVVLGVLVLVAFLVGEFSDSLLSKPHKSAMRKRNIRMLNDQSITDVQGNNAAWNPPIEGMSRLQCFLSAHLEKKPALMIH